MPRLIPCTLLLFCLASFCRAQGLPPVATLNRPEPKSDDWVYLDNGKVRLGVLRSSGAGIAYFALAGAKKNLLNHYDRGRLVQQSYYGDADKSMWGRKPWRYNPVQGGEYHGLGSRVLELRSDKTTLYAKTLPRHWATGAELPECVMEEWISLEDTLAHIRFQFTYHGTVSHGASAQEIPAVFVDSALSTLVTVNPRTAALMRHVPGGKNEYLRVPEHWAAYVSGSDRGLGVYVPAADEMTCYTYHATVSDADCSYLAPITTFVLKPGLVYTYHVFLAAGSPDEMRAKFKELHKKKIGEDPRQEISDILVR